jgi:hypothetical protein
MDSIFSFYSGQAFPDPGENGCRFSTERIAGSGDGSLVVIDWGKSLAGWE